MRKFNVIIILLLPCLTNFIYAQSSINGKITDDRSNPISRASVHLLNSNTGVISDMEGNFVIDNLPAGNYIVEFSAIGFASQNQLVTVGRETAPLQVTLKATSRRLDEVVVTAQKIEELLQNVPVSITSLSEKNVSEYRLWNSREITGIVPNLYSADPGDKRNVTSIRGITTTSYEPAVATYIDGVNQFSLDTYISPLFDVERIEVLRGPQGTLYGRNAMGGVINIITKQPGNRTSVFAEMNFGNYGQQRYTAGVRAPIVKNKLFFGLAGLYDKFNGFYTNEFNNSHYDKQHSLAGNYYVKFLPDNRWAVTVNVKHNNNRNNGPFPLVFGIDEAFAHPFKLNQNALTRIIDNTFNTSLAINYTGAAFNFSSITSYQKNYRYYTKPIDADFSPLDGNTLINNYGKDWNYSRVFTQELKFTSPANNLSKLSWTAGTYFFTQNSPTKAATHFGQDALLLLPPGTDSSIINSSIINTSKAKGSGIAAYGQATYEVSNKVDITAGLRFDYEHKNQSVLGEYQKDPDPNPQFETRPDTSSSTHYTAFQPKISLGYHATQNSFLFITYTRGYRAGGLTPLAADNSTPPLYPFEPEYSNNFEAGFKNSLFQNKLLMNFTVFYSTVRNAQVPTLILPSAVSIIKNTGELNSKGFEVELAATPARGFQLNYGFGYTHSKYSNLKVPLNGAETDLKGNFQIFTPDFTSMLAAQYALPLNKKDNVHFIIRGEWKCIGTQYFDLSNTLKQPSYGLLNTRAGVAAKNFEIMFYGRNLGDKEYIGYAYDFGAVHLGDPRVYGINLKLML